MRILIVISNASVGGAQRVAINLCDWLKKQQDVDVGILSLSKAAGKVYDIPGLIELKGKSITKQLKKLIKEKEIEVLISMGVPMALYTAPACWGTKTKHIISERNDPRHFAGKSYVRILSRLLMRTADGFVFQTEDARKFYHMEDSPRATVIHNPLMDAANIPIVSDNPEKTIVTAGRLVPQKNHELLIRSFAELSDAFPDYNLVIWGEGPDRRKLETLVNELQIGKRVSLPGITSEVQKKYASSSLFVLSSDFEGMPNALMEAMAVGLPCISTDCPCGGPGELVADGENGLLVPVGDKEAMKNAISKLLLNKEQAKKMGYHAMNIRSTHAIDSISEQWLAFCNKILRSGN